MDDLTEIKEKLAAIESLLQRLPEIQAAVFIQMNEEYQSAHMVGKRGRGKGMFDMDVDAINITEFYSDNEIYFREVRFVILGDRWSEFETSTMYQQLKEFVQSQQIQDTPSPHHVDEPELETAPLLPHSMQLGRLESFLARVRKLFRGI